MQPDSPPASNPSPTVDMRLNILLVGAGVVGRAITLNHLLSDIPVWMADRDEKTLSASCDWVLQRSDSIAESAAPWGAKIDLPIVLIRPGRVESEPSLGDEQWFIIESIAERLEIKQAFFSEAESWFDRTPIFTTNTSTLSIGKIAEPMRHPERLCGLHFFMPVVDRHAVEVIGHRQTAQEVIEHCSVLAERLGKRPLRVDDGPGFVVNRMLSTYVNLSMWFLCGGVGADVIEEAALDYGMPMSPLSLVDLIGPRTAFDGGRTVWSAYPHRMDPSPLLPALIKRKLTGVVGGTGFYHYDALGNRIGDAITPEAKELIERYQHRDFAIDTNTREQLVRTIRELFAATFRIEAQAIQDDQIADRSTIDLAMRYGLSCDHNVTLSDQDAEALAQRYPQIKSIQIPKR